MVRINLQDVAESVIAGADLHYPLREFFVTVAMTAFRGDAIDVGAAFALISDTPRLTGSRVVDAYLAAVAEGLSVRGGFSPPTWVLDADRFLGAPYFPPGTTSLRAILLAESPAAFRRRNLFVDSRALEPIDKARRAAHAA